MRENSNEKEKCLEKLNEMQSFLPFLDFMINKIKKKNGLSLDCQLNKFQHIRSVIVEKNGKYSLESLINIEEILQKLISKLDYKGFRVGDKKVSANVKTRDVTSSSAAAAAASSSSMAIPAAPPVLHSKEALPKTATVADSPPDASEGSAVPAITATTSEGGVEESKLCDESSSVADAVSKSVKNSQPVDVKEDNLDCGDYCNGSSGGEFTGNVRRGRLDSPGHGPTEKEEIDRSGNNVAVNKGNDTVGPGSPLSSRKQFLKCQSSPDSSSGSDLRRAQQQQLEPDPDGKFLKCGGHELLSIELSDISDDDNIIVEEVRKDRSTRESDMLKWCSGDVSRSKGDVLSKSGGKKSESVTSPLLSPVSDVCCKLKLRERLSADVVEVHKVPGKSVGGSLRSLKDIRAQENEPFLKADGGRDRRSSRHRHGSRERKRGTESDRGRGSRGVKKGSRRERERREWRSKSRDKSKDGKHHHRSEGEDKSGHSGRHSSSSSRIEKSQGREEKKEKRKKRLEIDNLNDQELLAFVNENISSFPHLSRLRPDELRRVARSSLLPDYDSSTTHAREAEKKSKDRTSNGKKYKSEKGAGERSRDPCPPTERKPRVVPESSATARKPKFESVVIDLRSSDTDEDEYARKLIEDTTPKSAPRPAPMNVEPEQEKPPVCKPEEPVTPCENKDPRLRHTTNTISVITSVGHVTNDPRTVNKAPQPEISPTGQSPSPITTVHSDRSCEARAFWSGSTSEQPFISEQYTPTQDDNRSNAFDGCTYEQSYTNLCSPYGNADKWYTNSNLISVPIQRTPEAKSYAEYKQLKRQEQENANKGRSSCDERLSCEEVTSPTEERPTEDRANVKSVRPPTPGLAKSTDNSNPKAKDSCRGSSQKCTKGMRNPQSVTVKSSADSSRKSVEGDKDQHEREDVSGGKLTHQDDEPVSPLEKLYGNDPKPVTGRGYGLQNFKIPKKGRSGKSNSPRPGERDAEEGRGETRKSIDGTVVDAKHADAGESTAPSDESGVKPSTQVTEKCSDDGSDSGKDQSKSAVGEKLDGGGPVENAAANKPKLSAKGSKTAGSWGISHGGGNEVKDCEQAAVADCPRTQKAGDDDVSVSCDSTTDIKESRETVGKPKTETDPSGKPSITDEITQELVEALISKSFESGEGELLLAKAKLFKELALKLNSKKLKTIQKIIYSESDSSSDSSDSSTASERRRKKSRKKRGSDEFVRSWRKSGKEKRRGAKDRPNRDGSAEGNDTDDGDDGFDKATSRNAGDRASISDESNAETGSTVASEPSSNSRKSQRKTKLLEQIFNESPSKDLDYARSNTPTEKECDQKSKIKGKGKGKTELDRLHEDIRSMFISSGVVTATGQRMCRMLRESGGKMNNLDIVKESAKMVEEEKLASGGKRRGRAAAAGSRSRSRSTDRWTLRDRSRSRVINGESMRRALDQPVVVLERLDLSKLPYPYRVRGLPASVTQRQSRNVARRGYGRRGFQRSTRHEEMNLNRERRVYLERNLRKAFAARHSPGKRAYKGRKLAEIIQKLPLKMAKMKHLEIGRKEEQSKKVKEPKESSPELDKKQKGEKGSSTMCERLLEYAFDKRRTIFACKLCMGMTKNITAHYKTKHPESEVMISRLSKGEAERAIQDSKANNYDMNSLEQACSLEMIRRRVKSKLTKSASYSCRMCNHGQSTSIAQFYNHVSSHTGEYRYKCPADGCGLTAASRDFMKIHFAAKHVKSKPSASKVIEMFPLPSEHGILFGYLCSLCNFVQLFRRNVETHIQKSHPGAEDARIIKIDMSGKTENEDEEEEGECEDPSDHDYTYNSDESSSCSGGYGSDGSPDDVEDEEDDNYRPRGARNSGTNGQRKKKRRKRRRKMDESEEVEGTVDEGETTAEGRREASGKEGDAAVDENDADMTDISPKEPETKWKVGPLEASMKSQVVGYKCRVSNCRFSTHQLHALEGHVTTDHDGVTWSGACCACDAFPEDKVNRLDGDVAITNLLKHMEDHLRARLGEEKLAELKRIKDADGCSKEEGGSVEVKAEFKPSEAGDESKDTEGVPYPVKPLLRVRNLLGDRLSKPKGNSEDEVSGPGSPITITDTDGGERNESEPCLFTIKDVRSLNPATKDAEAPDDVRVLAPQEVPGKLPPNAEVVSGKPVLIRSCPSPKITIRPETNVIPIPIAQAKQAVEVGQLKVVPPPPGADIATLGINKLITGTPIRIISPATFTSGAVIVPTFTTSSRIVSISKPVDSAQTTAVAGKPRVLQPLQKGLIASPLGKDVVIQKIDSPGEKVSVTLTKKPVGEGQAIVQAQPPAMKPILPSPSPAGETPIVGTSMVTTLPTEQGSSIKRQQQSSLSFGGKNIKDAKIYKEMLTKRKLCQLFKCMAVECSFTCNSDTIFTQHIGLHEAQQRIKGKKKPQNKVKKIFNWQQCAYCCEVLVHTGAALSQHILTEHGHCLYQCAYCFYRAVSETYVDLHQDTVHSKLLKKKRVIYKCKPVPGAVLSKKFEKQIRPHNVRPYHCEHCGSKFFIIQHFMEHLTKEHQSVTAYNCHICKILYFKADRLIAHYKLHSYSMYQCAYCLHGTESQKEMLFHLCNFHFSQPPLMCARALENPTKTDSIALDDLKLITFENETTDRCHIVEEADWEVEQESDFKDSGPIPISVDLSSIVSELGIDVEEDGSRKGTVLKKVVKDMESELSRSISLESMLPNAHFSTDSDVGNEGSAVFISSELTASEKKDEKDASVPIGQLPIEVVKMQTKDSTVGVAKQSSDSSEPKESVDEILMSLQQKNSSVTVSTVPSVEKKPVEESLTRTLHKLPPTIPVVPLFNRRGVGNDFKPKKLTFVKKMKNVSPKFMDTAPILFKQLCNAQTVPADRIPPKSVILALPVIDTPAALESKEEQSVIPAIQKVISLKRPAEESPESQTKVNDGGCQVGVVKRLCLAGGANATLISVDTDKESPLKISDVRSLSIEKSNPVTLQPPIIRVEDFKGDEKGNLVRKPENTSNEKTEKKPGDVDSGKGSEETAVGSESTDVNPEPPLSPEVIILEPEESNKNTRSELIEVVDSEDESEKKPDTAKREEEDKKASTEKDLDIRKQMEQLRNQMENETDCLLLDDTSQEEEACNPSEIDRSEDSTVCTSAEGDTSRTVNEDVDSTSLDSQHLNEGSSDKTDIAPQFQDSDSQNNSDECKETKKDERETRRRRETRSESINSDPERSNSSRTGSGQPRQELRGKELYLCGNGKCNFAAENDVDLKDHLYICDFSRESSMLVCPHCSKQLKHSTPYVEHIKLHGEKRFSCGLCNFNSALEMSVTRHLKQKHKCSQTKTLPNDSVKPGHFVMYPKNYKKEKQNGEVNIYSPGDEDKLPLQSIYQNNVKCAKCPYITKVRSNMVRHLKIHTKAVEAEGSIVVPSTAPTNPVPCLDAKEKMFDKMTNLAASSQLAQARQKMEALSPEEEAKLPQFVPEQMRHKCCSPDCNYLTIDDNMLKHHIKALHDEINVYSCPHCRETVHVEFRFVPLDKIGQHLKYHDVKLYKCCHCLYFHHQKYIVEKHVMEKHPERRFYVYTVREPKAESASEDEQQQQLQQQAPNNHLQQQQSTSGESFTKMWKCGLCDDFESLARPNVLEHLAKVHNTKSKFKCKHCDVKSSQYTALASHFASKHPGKEVEYIKAVVTVNRPSAESGQGGAVGQDSSNDHFDTTPLWQRDAPRIRHIRGILIEEEEIKTKRTKRVSSDTENEVSPPAAFPPDAFYCPLCTDKKKFFRSKSADSFRNHLYQELNYQQYACILCGKMFVDRKDCERHHLRAHPNRTQEIKQTKEDSEIKFWVEKVVAKQQSQILERKRRLSSDDSMENLQPPKKKVQAKGGASEEASKEPPSPPPPTTKKPAKARTDSNRPTRASSSDPKAEPEGEAAKRRSSDDKAAKSDFVRQTRSVSGTQVDEPSRKCPHCSYETTDLSALKTHIKLRHLRMGKWMCPYCGETFQLEKEAAKHCKSSHPNEALMTVPNPDEEKDELKDDFWKEEYGFGREKTTKGSNEGEKTAARKDSPAISKGGPGQSQVLEPKSNIYSCGYCMIEVTDQSSIIQHFESHHKTNQEEAGQQGVVRTIYYRCSVCSEKLTDFDSLNTHAKDRHPKMTLQFEIRQVYKFDSWASDRGCSKCSREPCLCSRDASQQSPADKAKDGSYQCPCCPVICPSYLDCIDHFNEHYPRYSCGTCSLRFFTSEEIQKHQSEMKHKAPYAMTIPSEKMLDEFKAGVTVKRNGMWVPLQTLKALTASDDGSGSDGVKKSLRSMTARKSTTQVPDRRGHGVGANGGVADKPDEGIVPSKDEVSLRASTPPPPN